MNLKDLENLEKTLAAQREPTGEFTLRPTLASQPPPLKIDPREGPTPVDLELRGDIGQGGLGKVELFWQRSLQREVAVKSVRDDQLSELTLRALLDEARVTGTLEHPGIVPIHALTQHPSGNPCFIMKRVEGHSWHDLIKSKPAISSEENLRRHIEIVMQLCNSLHFAHSRGFLHRDIKPRNVMVGDFGEVYLLDWGLALPWRGGVSSGSGFAGTLQYMAPEMLRQEMPLGPETDVYLLGASLYEALTLKPPHQGNSVKELIMSISRGTPPGMGSEVPAELAALCQRALHPEPSARFASAALFRAALSDFLSHRGSHLLAESAPVETLSAALVDSQSTDAQRRKFFVECRFGLQQALVQWPENTLARERLSRCLREMLSYEISQKNIAGAEGLLSEIEDPNPQDIQRLNELKQREQEEKARVEALHHQFNPEVSQRHRQLLTIVCGVFFGLLCASFFWVDPKTLIQDRSTLLLLPGIFLLVFGAGLFWLRRELLTTQLNRQLALMVLLADLVIVLNRLLGWVYQTPGEFILSSDLLLVFALFFTYAITASLWFLRLVGFSALWLAASLFWPQYSFIFLGLCLCGSFLIVLLSKGYTSVYAAELLKRPPS